MVSGDSRSHNQTGGAVEGGLVDIRNRRIASVGDKRGAMPGAIQRRSSQSLRLIYIAAAANLGVAVCKCLAAAVTGSSAMWAEAFHSIADCGNEFLLLLGMKRSQRPADALHPFGHGKALYFYSLLVAVYIFGIGATSAVYEGISHILKPGVLSHTSLNYLVLALAGVFDSYSWRVSCRELRARKATDESIWSEIVGSKDPAVFTIFLEDSAALAGIFLAFLGIFLGHMLHNPYFDPAASIAIGVLLALVAVLLGRESGALLVGERASRARIKRLGEIIRNDPAVERLGSLLTMQLGPDEVLLAAEIKFRRGLDVQQLESVIGRIKNRIRSQDPMISRMFIEADSLQGLSMPPAKSA